MRTIPDRIPDSIEFYDVLVRPLFQIYRDAFSGLSRELWVLGITALVNRCGRYVYDLSGPITLWHGTAVVVIGL